MARFLPALMVLLLLLAGIIAFQQEATAPVSPASQQGIVSPAGQQRGATGSW